MDRDAIDIPRIVVYTTDSCGPCESVKLLLERRGAPYQEVRLTRDPGGRRRLVEVTGNMTFPQIVVGGEPLGGFRELLEAEREGRLDDILPA